MKTEPVPVGADATIYVWFLGRIFIYKSRTCTVLSASAVTASVLMLDSDFLLGQCEFFCAAAAVRRGYRDIGVDHPECCGRHRLCPRHPR